jgi:hypothetical protein
MKYFYDIEFIEDGKTIDLISIGIVADDGREYYAISTQFNPKKASDWVVENVIKKLPIRYPLVTDTDEIKLQSLAWRNRNRIREDILNFCNKTKYGTPEFWAYYADYDHVALCQLFGKMIDLPKGWPMYTNDVKQFCDSKGNPRLPEQDPSSEHSALADAKWTKEAYEFLCEYHEN